MPKVTYDVSNVEDASDFKQAPVGMYIAKVKEFTVGESKTAKQPMGTVVLELVSTSDGKKLKERFSNVWHRVPLDDSNPGWTFRLKEFIKALALPLKGGFDPEKLAGKKVQVKLKSGTDLDDNYRPEVDKLYAMPADAPEPEEPDADDGEDDDGDDVDYSAMTLAQLKSEVAEYEGDADEIIEEAEATSAAAKKAALIEWLESDDEDEDEEDESTEDEDEDDSEEEPEDSEDEEDDEDSEDEEPEDDYDTWSMEDLKTELKDRDLKTAGKKSVLIARLRKDDSEEEPF